ncbi:uncharacterized protein ACB057_012090 [Neosynchiropus ocellatus]
MRRVRRKVANKDKVFGCDLLEHLSASAQEVPVVLRCCSEFVEQHGIVDGIYRLSGVSSNIQKLRSEFESDGSLDLNKDLYLQDIHCVSSLCKAYFRELPNPLLTYELYDKFAEAVAIQLEEERLVKIRDVLKELPPPHYRTLEFLMRHLVKMASHSSETNMHARNLAIVWAPNLLRSKDIETSGFNGTAAFMEVRVQSIVVEFILSHVAQLFPDAGESPEWSKSLPLPSATANQEEGFFKPFSSHVLGNIGNIGPGDGPLPMRPYHAIIEGTDKRKGSLKGRKWMSIFNIGGRFQDQKKRHKHSTKEKDRQTLRPARSMDSLSTQLHSKDGPRGSTQPPSNNNFVVPAQSSPAGGGSEYAITFRRGTGLVVGGTQGTYTALDPDGPGGHDSDGVQSRSPGLTTKAGRRAAMHITGPTLVTVPLHITSNLAQGLLQGGGSDRVVHRSRQRERGDEEVEEKERRKDSSVAEEKVTVREDGGGVEEREGGKEEEERGEQTSARDSVRSSSHQDQETADADEYVDMNPVLPGGTLQGAAEEDSAFGDVLNSTEVVEEELSGYVQDNFEFLDQMDCSVLDHMDHGAPHQVREFSVEPPSHTDNEYELMEQTYHDAPVLRSHLDPGHDPHRRLSISAHRHTKSLSLPYITSPVCPPEEPSSDEDDSDDDDDDDDDDEYSSADDDMLMKSLPPDFLFNSCGPHDEELDPRRFSGGGGERCEDDDGEEEGKEEEMAREEGGEHGLTHLGEEELVCEGEEEEERRNQSHRVMDLDQVLGDSDDDENDFPPPPPDCLDFPIPTAEDEENFLAAAGSDEERRDAADIPPHYEEAVEFSSEMIADGPPQKETGSCEGEDRETVGGEKTLLTDEEEPMEKPEELCSGNIWEELEDVVCEVIEDEERSRTEEETLDQVTDMKGTKQVTEKVTDEEHSGTNVQLPAPTPDVLTDGREGWTPEAVTRTLVVSKTPWVKVYQAKAVPVVPPKPQHCKIAAVTLRQRLREVSEQMDEDREAKAADRSSPVSMCFDEAVAIATLRREKKERQWEWGGEKEN